MHTVSRALEGALSASRLRSLSLPFLAVAAVGWSVGSVACSATPASLPLGQDTSDDSGGGSGSTSGSGSGSGSSSGSSSGSGVFQGADSGGMGTGTCQTGMYTGTFSCTFVYDPNADAAPAAGSLDAGSNPFPITITGSLSFLLTQSTSGELGQDMASGTFDLTAGITTGMATLGGTLECGSGQFTGGLSNGSYSLFGFTGPFDGPLTSDYNGTTFTFVNGTWSLVIPGEGYCPGTWTANYVGASSDASPD